MHQLVTEYTCHLYKTLENSNYYVNYIHNLCIPNIILNWKCVPPSEGMQLYHCLL